MQVTARFLAIPQGAISSNEMQVEVPEGTTVGELIIILTEDYPVLRSYTRFVGASVNRTHVGQQTRLQDGDVVIYTPPVGGG
jgi:molybdopterin synthase sulfur carrier subunit